jgi:hypothetical protein
MALQKQTAHGMQETSLWSDGVRMAEINTTALSRVGVKLVKQKES